MRVYADTSWWLAYKCRRDTHHAVAITLFDREPQAQVLWTPWHRVEVFNTFRQAERAGFVAAGESRQLVRMLEQEVRLGYWPHVEFNWAEAIRGASELSAAHSPFLLVRGMDLVHVAIALETGADSFLSFDRDQSALAEAAGLPLVRLPARPR
jgi:predicted nucleic acid-binding protein